MTRTKKSKTSRNPQYGAIIIGVCAALGLLSLYFILMTALNSFQIAIFQFKELGIWMILLSSGFGIQIGLFVYLKQLKRLSASSTMATTTNAGVSTVSMVACCAHHITDIGPLLGLTAATLFLSTYQVTFLILGIFSNLVGILLMLRSFVKCGVTSPHRLIRFLLGLNHLFLIKVIVLSGFIALALSVSFIARGG